MPFVLVAVGLLLLVAGVRGKEHELFALVQDDLIGSGGFVWWLVVIGIVGGIGYIKDLQPLSRGFLVLILIVMLIKIGGGTKQIVEQVNASTSISVPTQTTEVTYAGTKTTGTSGSSGLLDASLTTLENQAGQLLAHI